MVGFGVLLEIGLLVAAIILIALIGSTRRLGFMATLILSVLLTPIGGLLAALISGRRQRKPRRRPRSERLRRRAC